jgi:hypothetical protein
MFKDYDYVIHNNYMMCIHMPLAFCTSMLKNLQKLTQLRMIKGAHTTFATKEIIEMCWIGYTSFNVWSLLKLYNFSPMHGLQKMP